MNPAKFVGELITHGCGVEISSSEFSLTVRAHLNLQLMPDRTVLAKGASSLASTLEPTATIAVLLPTGSQELWTVEQILMIKGSESHIARSTWKLAGRDLDL